MPTEYKKKYSFMSVLYIYVKKNLTVQLQYFFPIEYVYFTQNFAYYLIYLNKSMFIPVSQTVEYNGKLSAHCPPLCSLYFVYFIVFIFSILFASYE